MKLEELVSEFELVNEIKERFENDNIDNGDKVIEAANALLVTLENLIVAKEEALGKNFDADMVKRHSL